MASTSESSSRNSESETEPYSDFVGMDDAEGAVFNNDLEPLATEEEANAHAVEVAREQQEEHELSRRFNREITIQSWCKCSRCSLEGVVKSEECRCSEIEPCREKMQCLGESEHQLCCITEHPGFNEVCLNKWVLEVAGLSLKSKNGKRYTTMLRQGRTNEDEFCRAVSYRQFIRLVWGYTGRSQRFPLPCCAYNAIRKAFSTPGNVDFRGYESEEDD